VPLVAQTPAADWRTVETPHFRVHYPRPFEAWTMRAATHLESIRDAVAREAGYVAETKADVIVTNPVARANGLTYTLLDTPRIVLYAEPAEAAGQLGEFGDWIDLLVTHEMTHLVHLDRRSRNPARRALELLLPIGPIALNAPRWVNEGYATVIEGRLTGSGRPSSAFRAAVLRKWAESGQLPTYAQLDSDYRFLGMSMAYLMGSAFLEWLEARNGAGSLPKVWARMTARQPRGFESAFEGVFGDSPRKLYGLFTTELTQRAHEEGLHEGELWQDTSRGTGDPAVSPDGKQIALVIRDEHRSKLVVFSTGENEEEKKHEERIAKMLERDPQDVAPVRTKPLPRKPVHSLTMPDGGDIESPRWMGDGIVFTHRVPDTNGDLHRDLFVWDFHHVRRVTHGADVYDADVIPSGSEGPGWAGGATLPVRAAHPPGPSLPLGATAFVAVRSRFGMTQLVTVSNDGDVRPITEPSIDRVVSHPRVNGNRLAYVAHTNVDWQLVVDDKTIPFDGNVADPEWSGNDIYATVLANGAIDIVRFPAGERVTRMSGGAFQPAPSPDGRLFFMALEPDGFKLHVLPRVDVVTPLPATRRNAGTTFESRTTSPPRPYGIGRQERTWILSGNDAPGAHTTEAGVRIGDVVGRLDTIVVASFGDIRGATIAPLWRGLPIALGAQAYEAREAIGKQHGLEMRASWNAVYPLHDVAISGGVLARSPSSLAFFSSRIRFHQLKTREDLAFSAESHHTRLFGRFEGKVGQLKIGGEAQRDQHALVGGVASTILPLSAVADRVLDPALETGTLRGTHYTGARADVSLDGVTLFYRQHRMDGERLNVEGVEAARRLPAMPIIKAPAVDVTAGVARVVHRTRWWIGVRLSP
jgi:hypothetical protein